MATVTSKSSNIGGAGGTATPGGYNQGGQFGASKGGDKPGSAKDLRGNTSKSGGYNQGTTVEAKRGGDKPGSNKDLRGGTSKSGSGYNQGAQK